jgi:hypothetical protein
MRELRLFESISIDGYFTGVNDDMSWAHAGSQYAEFSDSVWNNSYLLNDNLVKAVRDLKASDGPNITVLGSGTVAAIGS